MTVGSVEQTLRRGQAGKQPTGASAPVLAPVALEGRANNFDLMRVLMAVLVVWSHCFPFLLGEGDRHEPLFRWTSGRTTFGGVAVDVFFIISGFLVTMSWERTANWWRYLKKRAARIYPGYIAATLVCAFVVAPLFVAQGAPWMTWQYFGRLLGALPRLEEYVVGNIDAAGTVRDGVFMGNPVPGSMYGIVWTVHYEFWCYLLVMGMGLMGILKRRGVVLGMFFLVLALWMVQRPDQRDFGWVHLWWPHRVKLVLGDIDSWPRLLAFYLSGMVFYLYRREVPLRGWLAGICVLGVLLGMWVLPLLPVTMALCGAYLVFWAAFQQRVTAPHFARYGDFSYGIYLYGFPLQQILVALLGTAMAPWQLFLLAVPATVAVAAGSWWGVERWFLRRVRSAAALPS